MTSPNVEFVKKHFRVFTLHLFLPVLDRWRQRGDKCRMSRQSMIFGPETRWVVGSIGTAAALGAAGPDVVPAVCDVVEIRLDALAAEGLAVRRGLWAHLSGRPLLFTARRPDEGGLGGFAAAERLSWLAEALPDAAAVDVELAGAGEAADFLAAAAEAGVPWVASCHDFGKLPENAVLADAARRACELGAAVFKVAARLHGPADLARLAEFQLADHGLPVASMGMGPLAGASRLLCAQCGSTLNYGYLGGNPTAPGQWPAALLKEALEWTTAGVALENPLS